MRVRLMDGDVVLLEEMLAEPLPRAIVVPAASKDGRCLCTKPVIRQGRFCRQAFLRREVAPDGLVVYRIAPRGAARMLINTLTPAAIQ